MRNDRVARFRKKDEVANPLAELLRKGALELIGRAVDEESGASLEQQAGQRETVA